MEKSFETYRKAEAARRAADAEASRIAAQAFRAVPGAPAAFERLALGYANRGLTADQIVAALREQLAFNARVRGKSAPVEKKSAADTWAAAVQAVNREMGLIVRPAETEFIPR
jgi:hypothetical protein